jgi:SAM-dependent methyltransferase
LNTKAFWEEKLRTNPAKGRVTQLNERRLRFAKTFAHRVAGKRVLDIGCGGGVLSAFLVKKGASVVGLDFSPTIIARAKKNFEETERLKFVEADILKVDLGEQFDIICGIAVLHEISQLDTPRLFEFFDRHLKADGFGWFQENSFFNPAFRFVRNHLVGKYGIPKVGSDQEMPFDRQRFELYRRHFEYCDRSAEAFLLFEAIHNKLVRSRNQKVKSIFVELDKQISNFGIPDGLGKNLTYWQHIYFSNAYPKNRVL